MKELGKVKMPPTHLYAWFSKAITFLVSTIVIFIIICIELKTIKSSVHDDDNNKIQKKTSEKTTEKEMKLFEALSILSYIFYFVLPGYWLWLNHHNLYAMVFLK